jgi:hypothetical protein
MLESDFVFAMFEAVEGLMSVCGEEKSRRGEEGSVDRGWNKSGERRRQECRSEDIYGMVLHTLL